MSDKLWTGFYLLSEVAVYVALEIIAGVQINSIPKFWLTRVHIVDRVKIHVLLVPAEHCLPRADVDVRWCYTFEFGAL